MDAYLQILRQTTGLEWISEYRFHPPRRWRFDYACLELKIAIEVNGGNFVGGRHSNPVALGKEYEKMSQAAADGWAVMTCIMQINSINHEWLSEIGFDVMTYDGNIEAGIYIISQHLNKYGKPELALMAYNSGPTGAQKLWDAGTFQTDYSRKVMAAFEHWTSVLEG